MTTLPSILQQMLLDIKDPAYFYWIYTSYFEIQLPTDRIHKSWRLTPLFIDYDSIWQAELVNDGMLCDVILKDKLPAERERILVRYDQIYAITRFEKGKSISWEESELYRDSSKLN